MHYGGKLMSYFYEANFSFSGFSPPTFYSANLFSYNLNRNSKYSSYGTYFFVFNGNMQTKILPAKFIMKTDDDAFVRIDEVLSSLKTKPSNGLLYGLISFDSSPHREKDSKWYISDEVSRIQTMLLHLNG